MSRESSAELMAALGSLTDGDEAEEESNGENSNAVVEENVGGEAEEENNGEDTDAAEEENDGNEADEENDGDGILDIPPLIPARAPPRIQIEVAWHGGVRFEHGVIEGFMDEGAVIPDAVIRARQQIDRLRNGPIPFLWQLQALQELVGDLRDAEDDRRRRGLGISLSVTTTIELFRTQLLRSLDIEGFQRAFRDLFVVADATEYGRNLQLQLDRLNTRVAELENQVAELENERLEMIRAGVAEAYRRAHNP